MKTVKEIFGVEIGEKFDIKSNNGLIYRNCYFNKNKELSVTRNDGERSLFLELYSLADLVSGEAEIIKIKPEILDKKEKEFLSFIVNHLNGKKPISIIKHECGLNANKEFIAIHFDGDILAFPYFPKGTMYKGMELGHYYTLDELKI